jgi:glycosyltransferase involved in cell wall biosynthesis
MRVLLIYKKHREAVGRHYETVFRRMGFDVETFDLYKAPRWTVRAYARIVLPPIKNMEISQVMDSLQGKPDLVFEIEGGNRHLAGWNAIGVPKMFYALDSHLVYGFHRKILNDFDYVFAAQKQFIPGFKKVKSEVFWLPHAADPEMHRKLELPKLFDIGFVGQLDPKGYPERIRLIRKLRDKYNVLAVHGVFDEHMAKVYSLSKIGFNKSMKDDLTLRPFEIMSCGTMAVTDRLDSIYELFEDKKHLITYSDEKELDEVIRYYLEHEEEREEIAIRGQEEVHRKHTYERRVQEILKVIGIRG